MYHHPKLGVREEQAWRRIDQRLEDARANSMSGAGEVPMTKTIFKHKWITCYEGEQGDAFVSMDDGVLTVPITAEGEVLFITEYSVAYGQWIVFLPGGVIEPGETPAATANRELQEEAGYRAERLDFLGELYPMVKYLHMRWFVYLARDLQSGRLEADEGWPIEVERVLLSGVEQRIASARLLDSNVIAATYLARQFLAAEGRER